MKKIELIIRPEKLEPLKKILSKNEYSGLTVMSAMGCGHQKGYSEEFKKLGDGDQSPAKALRHDRDT